MDISTFDKRTLMLISEKINNALSGAVDGVEFRTGNCSFSGSNATFKLEVKLAGGESREMQDLRYYAPMYGIDLDKTHPVYTLIGYAKRSSKYPFLVTKVGSEGTYKITEDVAKRYFGKDAS